MLLPTADAAASPPDNDPCCAAAQAPRFDAATAGSRRRRLWELPDESHCPLIGVCLPLPVLRRLAGKVLDGPALPDYELHSCVVHQCSRRNALTEALQRELDRRAAPALRRFAAARSADALAALWRQALHGGDIAEALWAALTHPRCDAALAVRICRDVHMHQHQAGAMARADTASLRELTQRCEALERELADECRASAELRERRAAETATLGAQLMRVRAGLIARDSEIASLRDELAEHRKAVPDLDTRRELTERIARMAEQQRLLLRDNAGLRELLRAPSPPVLPEPAPPSATAASEPAPVWLAERAVLCVGGRGGDIARYRECVERRGGRFLHHDGGVEDNARRLDSSLAAADLVICQAGCISHNAYWLVKEHCKRTSKRCVFLERPSVAGLERGLALAAVTPDTIEPGATR